MIYSLSYLTRGSDMIEAFNTETAHHHGDAMPQLLKFRYKEFILRHDYKVPSYNGLEYDQYDTPAAVYFTWRDETDTIRAGLRATPTNRPYMIKDLWPQTVKDVPIPVSPTIWEATRFFIDKDMDEQRRHRAHGEILCALLEFGLHYGITDYIAIAAPKLWNYTFRRCGWPANVVGPVTDINFSEEVQTCMMNVTPAILDNVRSIMRIPGNVLSEAQMSRDEQLLVDKEIFGKLGVWPSNPSHLSKTSSRSLPAAPLDIRFDLD